MTILGQGRDETSFLRVHEPRPPGGHPPCASLPVLSRLPRSTRLTSSMASCLLVLILVLGFGAGAGAHAVLVGSEPGHGAILDEPPRRVLLRFNAALEHAVTRLQLLDVNRVATPLRAREAGVDRIVAVLPRLSPGVYTVVYKVLARDGHVTEGVIRFTIRAR